MSGPAFPTQRMTVPEFLAWAEHHQPDGRFELVNGRVVAMAPEKIRHTAIKYLVARALDDAIRDGRLPCTMVTDGVGIAIDEYTTREPDCSVQCGKEIDLDSMILDNPIIVVEVTSPSSDRQDSVDKLAEYFSVASIQHYLIVRPIDSTVVHHRRTADGIHTNTLRNGVLTLDPPGISVPVESLFGAR